MRMNWNDITLKKWYQIREVLEVVDEWTVYNLMDIVYDIDSTNMPIADLSKYNLDFMNTPIKDVEITQDKFIFNDRVYEGHFDLVGVTAAQFVDYQNYIKQEPLRFENVLSCFLIPKGHKYNDGYDLDQVKQDLLEMPITFVMKISFFFQTQLQTFASLFLYFLKADLEKMNLPKEAKEKMLMAMDKIGEMKGIMDKKVLSNLG